MSEPTSHPLHIDEARFASYRKILILAGPLILSQMGVMLMQIVDALFLANYSQSAIAAIGPAGLTYWMLCGFFMGVVGYTNTFVAQYVGAKRPERVGSAVWQGIYLALAAGGILFASSLLTAPLFHFIGHEPAIRADEITFFRILCLGGPAFMLSAALSGFYAGRNDNLTLMLAHLAGGLVNALLDYLLIFGHFSFPRLGIAGAGYATVTGQLVQVIILGILLFRPTFQRQFHTWRDRAPDRQLLTRMCLYGLPNGFRYIIEIAVWSVFLAILGRIDSDGLAASNIVWRINGIAFFPVIGLSIAVAMLVGQAQGANRPDLSRRVTLRGLAIAEIWMAAAALAMVLIPQTLLAPFFASGVTDPKIHALCLKLLWFVAAYCLIDGLNIVFMSMLSGTGDTRWLLITSGTMHLAFLTTLLLIPTFGGGLFSMWSAATIFICGIVIAWTIRFRSGHWRTKRVIEHAPPDLLSPSTQLPSVNLPLE